MKELPCIGRLEILLCGGLDPTVKTAAANVDARFNALIHFGDEKRKTGLGSGLYYLPLRLLLECRLAAPNRFTASAPRNVLELAPGVVGDWPSVARLLGTTFLFH